MPIGLLSKICPLDLFAAIKSTPDSLNALFLHYLYQILEIFSTASLLSSYLPEYCNFRANNSPAVSNHQTHDPSTSEHSEGNNFTHLRKPLPFQISTIPSSQSIHLTNQIDIDLHHLIALDPHLIATPDSRDVKNSILIHPNSSKHTPKTPKSRHEHYHGAPAVLSPRAPAESRNRRPRNVQTRGKRLSPRILGRLHHEKRPFRTPFFHKNRLRRARPQGVAHRRISLGPGAFHREYQRVEV